MKFLIIAVCLVAVVSLQNNMFICIYLHSNVKLKKFLSTFLSFYNFFQASAEFILKGKEDLELARRECIAEFGIGSELVAEYRNKIFKIEPPTPCYLRCVFSRLGLFDRETGFIIENYILQLGRGAGVTDAVRGCFDYTGTTDTCLWAYRGYMCFREKGLLPEGY